MEVVLHVNKYLQTAFNVTRQSVNLANLDILSVMEHASVATALSHTVLVATLQTV